MAADKLNVKAKLQFRRFGHQAGIPGRLENDFHVNFLHIREIPELVLDIGFQDVAHAASGSRHRHFDIDPMPALIERRRYAGVDEAEIGDVYRYLRDRRPSLADPRPFSR